MVNISAQEYNSEEKEGLRKILRQEGTNYNFMASPYHAKNFELFGLTEADTLNWYNTEEWVAKYTGLTWNNASPKSVTAIKCEKVVDYTSYDLTAFTELDSLTCSVWKYGIYAKSATIDLSQNSKLRYLAGTNIKFTNNSFETEKDIEKIHLLQSSLSEEHIKKMPRLKSLTMARINWNYADFSNNPLLETCDIHEYLPQRINLLNNSKLTRLSMTTGGSNNLRELDLSGNTDLEYLMLSTLVNLKELDLSSNLKLSDVNLVFLIGMESVNFGNINPETLNFNQNILITSVDFSKMSNLKKLVCTTNRGLTNLDLSQNVNLEEAICSDNKLTSIILPSNPKLTTFDCSRNNLLFSELPLYNIENYTYNPQNDINGGSVGISDIIDLSGEYTIDGQVTTFSWFKNERPITLEGENGKFELTPELADTKLVCKMTNTRFPDLVLNYNVTIKADDSPGPVGIENPDADDNAMKVESNLINQGSAIVLLSHSNEEGYTQLYNTAGQIVSTSKITGERTEIKAPETQGIYVLKAKSMNGANKSFKLIVK